MGAGAQSLRQRLLWTLLGVISAVWLLALSVAWFEAHHELDELLDRRLEQTAALLLELDIDEESHRGAARDRRADSAERNEELQFQVWRRDGTLLQRSPNAPSVSFSTRDGYQLLETQGRHWQSFGLWSQDGHRLVRVYDDEGQRRHLTAEIIGRVALPLAVALPLLAVLILIAISRSLRPLSTLSRAVAQRSADHMSPLMLDEVPDEARPLVQSLNDLLERLRHSLEAEKRFTADAAHELRTPLAVIRAQAQVAQASTDEAERSRALASIVEGADRATRLAVQLLTLARAEHDAPMPDTPVDLGEVARACVALRAETALQRQQHLSLRQQGVCIVKGQIDLLEALCGNLIDNALTYVPEGGRIEIEVTAAASSVQLRVVDDGPGVRAEDRERLSHRFYRAPGTQGSKSALDGSVSPPMKAQGSGLGLAIVRQIAHRHQASLQLTEGLDGRGLGVTVTFAQPR